MHRITCCLFLLLFTLSSFSQNKETFRIMFWNVENLFDTEDDPVKEDEEFTPTAVRGWSYKRYKKKVTDISRVITAVGKWEQPALVGLCEVENDNVLTFLTRYSPLKSYGYQYVMTESADMRGIDVALLYQKDRFKLLGYQSIRPNLGPNERPTRDILHVTGLMPTKDTLDVMVVHFPSRSGGERESEPKRLLVARMLKNTVDSLTRVRREPRIVIMGDFNDYPENRSIKEVLRVKQLPDDKHPNNRTFNDKTLYHLLSRQTNKKTNEVGYGSYKYKGEWGLLDHLIVSGKLLDFNSRIYTYKNKAEVVRLPFMLIDDEKFGGKQLFRTYSGMRYQGGYSDHLPVQVDLELSFD